MSKFFLLAVFASIVVASCMARSLEISTTNRPEETGDHEIDTRNLAQWFANQNWHVEETVRPNGDREISYSLYNFNPQVTLFGKPKPVKGKRSVVEDTETKPEPRDFAQWFANQNWRETSPGHYEAYTAPIQLGHISLFGNRKPSTGK